MQSRHYIRTNNSLSTGRHGILRAVNQHTVQRSIFSLQELERSCQQKRSVTARLRHSRSQPARQAVILPLILPSPTDCSSDMRTIHWKLNQDRRQDQYLERAVRIYSRTQNYSSNLTILQDHNASKALHAHSRSPYETAVVLMLTIHT